MFDSKKDADAYDKMLELAEQFTELLQRQIPEVDEAKAEEFGIFLAKNKEAIISACKGKTEALAELHEGGDSNVHSLAAEG